MDEKLLIKELTNACDAKNNEAFTRIYDIYYPKVFHFARLYATSEQDIAEIVQDVFVKLWENRHKLSEEKGLEGLLFIMTRNLIFNAGRSKIRESVFKMTVVRAMEAMDSGNLEDEVIATDLKAYIDELISILPPRQREIFILSREQQLSYREIAERFNITEKAVERHIYLALKFLKKNIANLLVVILIAKSFGISEDAIISRIYENISKEES